MKATGIVRRIDDLGRIVIPREIRKTFNIKEGDPLEIYTDNGYIVFKKYEEEPQGCVFCGKDATETLFDKPCCKSCWEKVKLVAKR